MYSKPETFTGTKQSITKATVMSQLTIYKIFLLLVVDFFYILTRYDGRDKKITTLISNIFLTLKIKVV